MRIEEGNKLLFEGFSAVVLALGVDVFDGLIDAGNAYAEGSVSLLPGAILRSSLTGLSRFDPDTFPAINRWAIFQRPSGTMPNPAFPPATGYRLLATSPPAFPNSSPYLLALPSCP